MRSYDFLQYAKNAEKISQGEIDLIRKVIKAESFEGIEDLRRRYEDADYQGHFPSWAIPVERAYEEDRRRWKEAAEIIVSSKAYEEAVSQFGKEEVVERVFGWTETPSEVIKSLSNNKNKMEESKVDEDLGKKGDLDSLAKMYPKHVKSKKGYSESGDGGWAGGGPDSWSEWTDYVALTEAGKLAIEKVKAGERPKIAMELSIEEVRAKLEEEGKQKSEAEALASADFNEKEKLKKEERNAFLQLSEIKPISGKGRTPWYRRSPERWKADLDDYKECLRKVEETPTPTKDVKERKQKLVSEYSSQIDYCSKKLETAIKLQSILDDLDNSSNEELKELQLSEYLIGRDEKSRIENLLEEREQKEIEKKDKNRNDSFSSGAWGALDKLK